MKNKSEENFKRKETLNNNKKLIVLNDDINTFDHVIKTLIKICEHTNHQAEQCTYLIHYKGRCTVKEGNNQKLIKLKEKIKGEGLNAIIK